MIIYLFAKVLSVIFLGVLFGVGAFFLIGLILEIINPTKVSSEQIEELGVGQNMPHLTDYRDISALEPYIAGGVIRQPHFLRRADDVFLGRTENFCDSFRGNVFPSSENERLVTGWKMRSFKRILSECR